MLPEPGLQVSPRLGIRPYLPLSYFPANEDQSS